MSTFWNDKVGWEIFLAKNLHKKKIVCNFAAQNKEQHSKKAWCGSSAG